MTNSLGPIEDSTPIQSWLHKNGNEMVVIYLHNGHYHVVYQTTFKCITIEEAHDLAEIMKSVNAFVGPSVLHYPDDWEDVSAQMPNNVELNPIFGSPDNGET